MIIHYMSDLHLEFGAMHHLPCEGDVLLLAGDITVARYLNPKMTDPRSRSVRKATHKLLDMARERFDKTIVIGGNHEPYDADIEEAEGLCRRHINGRGVQWVENEVVEVGDVAFVCCTLWTDMDRRNPLSMMAIGSGLNDFYLIEANGGRFSPDQAAERHDASLAFLKEEVGKRAGRNVVVVTHHAPTRRGLNRDHSGNGLDGAYASDLDDFIHSHPQIRYWVFGHTHVARSFRVGETWLKTNCRGYVGHEKIDFDAKANFAI